MSRFFSRTLAILALIILAMPPYDGKPDRYIGVAIAVFFPWFLHMLDVLFGFGQPRPTCRAVHD